MTRAAKPRTLREAKAFFADEDRCLEFAAALRWPRGLTCPTCGGRELSFLASRRVWKCRNAHPRQQFSVKAGTIFEDSPIGLDKWFTAMWLAANQPDGVTSYEMAAELDVTPKTALYMIDRMKRALAAGNLEALGDEDVIRLPFDASAESSIR